MCLGGERRFNINLNEKHMISDNDMDLPALDDFAEKFCSKYPNCVVTTYQIIRDLTQKQEVHGIQLIDGDQYGREQYFINCSGRVDGRDRIYLPLSLNADIDIQWLVPFH